MEHVLIHLGRHLPGPVIGFVVGAGLAIAFEAGFPLDFILVGGLTLLGALIQERVVSQH